MRLQVVPVGSQEMAASRRISPPQAEIVEAVKFKDGEKLIERSA